jgi:cyclohexanone monooxygenase
MSDSKPLTVAVIGAGASGLVSAIKAKAAGHRVTIFDKAPDLGGTWHYNRYPGLACDVPCNAYSFSFALNPEWTSTFASGPEIKGYLKRVAEQHGMLPLIRLSTEIIGAELVGTRWRLTSKKGVEGEFDAVIAAIGILHKPVYPDIAGLDTFAGATIHTAYWDDSIDLDNKRVGIIGTGSTSTQLTVAIVERVAKLSVFQRTAQWVFPQGNELVPEETKATYRSDPSALKAEYDRLNYQANYKFAAAVVGQNKRSYDKLSRLCHEHLEREVKDPVLRAKLTPDYPVGCKRLVMSDKFYGAIQQSNAELVTDPIERIEPRGIRTKDGRLHELDVLVLATGFDPFFFLGDTHVVGQGGRVLNEEWADAKEAYLGVSIPGFPNFFMIGGPNSPLGNFSWILTAETQCDFILKLLEVVRSGDARLIAPSKAATATFNSALKEAMSGTVWTAGCRSWYIDKKGNVASWPYSYERFVELMSAPNLDHFDVA